MNFHMQSDMSLDFAGPVQVRFLCQKIFPHIGRNFALAFLQKNTQHTFIPKENNV